MKLLRAFVCLIFVVQTYSQSAQLKYNASEGTWMSVDVSRDGKKIAFDLLGHIYEMPISGGVARR